MGERRVPLTASGRTSPALACGAIELRLSNIQVDVPRDQVAGRGRATAIRHVDDLGAGHVLEQLAADMTGRTGRGRRIGQLAGMFWPSSISSFTEWMVDFGATDSSRWPCADQHDRLEVAHDVVGHLRHHVGADRQRADRAKPSV